MKHLYAVGDSNTQGDELGEDDGGRIDYPYRHKHCYVGQLAQIYGLNAWTNDGYGGSSNEYMVRKTMQFTSQWLDDGNNPEDLFVIVGWSNATRREFYYEPALQEGDEFNRKEMHQWPEEEDKYFRYFVGMQKSKNLRFPSDEVRDFCLMYNRWFCHLPSSITRTLNNVIGLQSYLKCMGFPYLFFNAAWIIDVGSTNSQALSKLIDHKRFLGAHDRSDTFSGWTWEHGFQGRMPRGHPDEKAHAAWAKRLRDHIEEFNLENPK